MGRPKGSTNKPKIEMMKNGNAVIKVKLDKQVESAPRTTNSMRGWINWGQRNDYPLQLSNLYYNSPTHKACVDFAVSAIIGNGLDYSKMSLKQEEVMPNYQETWEELLEKIALDYIIYGSYAIQIIKNKDNKTYSFYHQSIGDVRCGVKDEDGVITSYWVSSDWTAIGKYPPVEMASFNFQDDEKVAQGKTYLYVYQGYSPDLLYYQLPSYTGGIKAIQTEIELLRYDLRSVLNNFSASGVLTLNQIDSDDERKTVLDNIEAMFQGTDNANALMVMFRNNSDDKPVEFTAFDKSVNHVNLFGENNERTIERILSAHRIPSKQLIGYSSDNAQLGGTGNEMAIAFNIYNLNVGNKNRNKITDTLTKIFKMNGIDVTLELIPLKFNLDLPTETVDVNEVKEEDIDKEQYSTDNIEEKEVSKDKINNVY